MCTHIYGRHCAQFQIKSESDTIFYYTIYVCIISKKALHNNNTRDSLVNNI